MAQVPNITVNNGITITVASRLPDSRRETQRPSPPRGGRVPQHHTAALRNERVSRRIKQSGLARDGCSSPPSCGTPPRLRQRLKAFDESVGKLGIDVSTCT